MDKDSKEFSMETLRERIRQRCKEKHMTHIQLAEKSGVNIDTINSWLRNNEVNAYGNTTKNIPHIDRLYKVAVTLGVSLDYLTGRENFTRAVNKDMFDYTGLSDAAIECLHGWYKDRQQGGYFSPCSNDIDTLNTILEYYGNIRKKNAKKGVLNGYTLFHFISNFINAHKFKRVQQDLIRYGNGKGQFFDLETGDTVTQKATGKRITINTLCTPISRGSYRGEDTTKIDLVNSENNTEQYYVEVSEIYREYAKSQIVTALKKIGGIK